MSRRFARAYDAADRRRQRLEVQDAGAAIAALVRARRERADTLAFGSQHAAVLLMPGPTTCADGPCSRVPSPTEPAVSSPAPRQGVPAAVPGGD